VISRDNFGEAPLRRPHPSDILRGLQERAGITNADFAEACDVSESVVAGWLRGASKPHGAVIAYLRLLVKIREIAG